MKQIILVLLTALILSSCTNNNKPNKNFVLGDSSYYKEDRPVPKLKVDSLDFETRPRNVLLTTNDEHRLTPIYKVNYRKKSKKPYTGTNSYHVNYNPIGEINGNQWNLNFMPGFQALYGFELINVSHFNNKSQKENKLFEKPVLIKTLYYPAYSNDTLNGQPVKRNFYMVSAYDEDTNKDGYITFKDLRRFYCFNLEGKEQTALLPKDYSVMNSEYDPANDFMYVFARKDLNGNGEMENSEPINIFWIDLNNPNRTGKEYE